MWRWGESEIHWLGPCMERERFIDWAYVGVTRVMVWVWDREKREMRYWRQWGQYWNGTKKMIVEIKGGHI